MERESSAYGSGKRVLMDLVELTGRVRTFGVASIKAALRGLELRVRSIIFYDTHQSNISQVVGD